MINALIYLLAPILIFALLLGLSHIWKILGLVDPNTGQSKSLGCIIVIIIIISVIILSTMQFADGYRVYRGY